MTYPAEIETIMSALCKHAPIMYATAEVPNWRDRKMTPRDADARLIGKERGIFEKIRSNKRRAEFLAGRIAARKLICGPTFGLSKEAAEIGRTALGAPKVSALDNISLSITHTSEIAVAVVASCDIGVDLERNASRPDALIAYFFSNNEKRAVDNLEQSTRRTRLINQLWTRKEAAAKVVGLGGSVPFRNVDCMSSETSINGRTICLASNTTDGYVASIAYDKEVNDG